MRKRLIPKVKKGIVILASSLMVTSFWPSKNFPTKVYADDGDILKNITIDSNMEWAKSKMTVHDSKIVLNLAGHFPLNGNIEKVSAISSSTNVVDAEVINENLTMNVQTDGTVNVTMKAVDNHKNTLIDTFKVTIEKMGDGDGDGVITSADIQLINQIISGRMTVNDEEKKKYDIDKDGVITRNDAVKLKDIFLAGPNYAPSFDNYYITLEDVNDAPVVHKVKMNGTNTVGEVLTGEYVYSDVENDLEGNTLFQWYRGVNADGSDKEKITGAIEKTYTLTDFDTDHYVFFEVTPIATVGKEQGESVYSDSSELVKRAQLPLVMESLSPQDDAVNVTNSEDFIITFNKNVNAKDKSIKIIRKDNANTIAQFQANNTQYVKVDQNKVFIKNPGLAHGVEYFIQVETGAFTDENGVEFSGIQDQTTWNLKANNPNPNPYISEYLNGLNNRIAIEVYFPDNGFGPTLSGYKLEVYQYDSKSRSTSMITVPFFPTYVNTVNITIDSMFYDFFDITGAWYYNNEIYLANKLNYSIVLKDNNNNIVDEVGNRFPTDFLQSEILASGKTMVRKSGIKAGSTKYSANEWNVYLGGSIYSYIGHHIP